MFNEASVQQVKLFLWLYKLASLQISVWIFFCKHFYSFLGTNQWTWSGALWTASNWSSTCLSSQFSSPQTHSCSSTIWSPLPSSTWFQWSQLSTQSSNSPTMKSIQMNSPSQISFIRSSFLYLTPKRFGNNNIVQNMQNDFWMIFLILIGASLLIPVYFIGKCV